MVIVLIPTASPWYLLIGSAITIMFGGFSPFLMAVLCYVTDITDERERGFRQVGINSFLLFLYLRVNVPYCTQNWCC